MTPSARVGVASFVLAGLCVLASVSSCARPSANPNAAAPAAHGEPTRALPSATATSTAAPIEPALADAGLSSTEIYARLLEGAALSVPEVRGGAPLTRLRGTRVLAAEWGLRVEPEETDGQPLGHSLFVLLNDPPTPSAQLYHVPFRPFDDIGAAPRHGELGTLLVAAHAQLRAGDRDGAVLVLALDERFAMNGVTTVVQAARDAGYRDFAALTRSHRSLRMLPVAFARTAGGATLLQIASPDAFVLQGDPPCGSIPSATPADALETCLLRAIARGGARDVVIRADAAASWSAVVRALDVFTRPSFAGRLTAAVEVP